MSFDRLMEDATNIQSTAIRLAVKRGEAEPDYARHGVESYYGDIPGLFKPFSEMPNPAAYGPMIEDLRHAMSLLSAGSDNQNPIDKRENFFANPVLAKMTTVGDYLIDWTGTAAMGFKQNFVDPFPPLCRNHFILSAIVKAGLEAHRSMWEKARADIDHIAHATLDALENQGCCDSNKWTITFTVVASVAAIAAVPLAPVSLTAALVVTAIGGAAQVTAASPPEAPKVEYQGETVIQVIGQMKQAIQRLAEEIRNTETKIVEVLEHVHQVVFDHRPLFAANRPELADAKPDNVTGQRFMGEAS